MPATIVTETRWVEPVETCPAPECNSSQEDVERFLEALTEYMERFEPAFRRVEQSREAQPMCAACWGMPKDLVRNIPKQGWVLPETQFCRLSLSSQSKIGSISCSLSEPCAVILSCVRGIDPRQADRSSPTDGW